MTLEQTYAILLSVGVASMGIPVMAFTLKIANRRHR